MELPRTHDIAGRLETVASTGSTNADLRGHAFDERAWPHLSVVITADQTAGRGRLDRTWMLLAAGVSTFWLADSLYLVKTAQGTYESGGWFDAGWWAGLMLIALAAWQSAPVADKRPADEHLRQLHRLRRRGRAPIARRPSTISSISGSGDGT